MKKKIFLVVLLSIALGTAKTPYHSGTVNLSFVFHWKEVLFDLRNCINQVIDAIMAAGITPNDKFFVTLDIRTSVGTPDHEFPEYRISYIKEFVVVGPKEGRRAEVEAVFPNMERDMLHSVMSALTKAKAMTD